MRSVPLLLALLLALRAACAQQQPDPAALLNQGNEAYQRGDFEGASRAYRALWEQGCDGPTVLFNLGNAELGAGHVGAAIACYLRAQRLAPRDRDIRTNLQRAWQQRVLGEPAPPAMWLHAVGRALVGGFTLSELAVAAALLYWAAMGMLVRYLQRGTRRWRRALIALAPVLATTMALAWARWWDYHHLARGVVTVETTAVRDGPGESFEVVQQVQDGRLVQILRSEGDWLQVIAEGGGRGWLPAQVVTVVQP